MCIRDRFCDILMDYLKRGVMPFADNDKNYPYHESEEPQTKEQLWAKLVEQNKKLSPDDPDAKRKLYNHCCMSVSYTHLLITTGITAMRQRE